MDVLNSKSTIAVPPGATIHEQLVIRGMSQQEFAQRMSLSEKHISRLINGRVELTHDVALRLESVLGVPAAFWNNLESLYREQLARVKAENEMEEDIVIAQKFPYSEMSNLGWVPPTKSKETKVANLRKFFEVARLRALDDLRIPGIAYRKTGKGCESDFALAAWAQKARLEARSIHTSKINIEKLKDSISGIRSLTVKSPDVFCPKLRNLLCECGIVIVFLPHIGGSFLHGATFIDGEHIVLGLTVRGRDADRFWFSLFHELAHILLGHIFNTQGNSYFIENERLADQYAGDTLISPSDYQRFKNSACKSKSAIIQFANEIGIAPGIVVGRLQKENIIPYEWYHDLKEKYIIAAE